MPLQWPCWALHSPTCPNHWTPQPAPNNNTPRAPGASKAPRRALTACTERGYRMATANPRRFFFKQITPRPRPSKSTSDAAAREPATSAIISCMGKLPAPKLAELFRKGNPIPNSASATAGCQPIKTATGRSKPEGPRRYAPEHQGLAAKGPLPTRTAGDYLCIALARQKARSPPARSFRGRQYVPWLRLQPLRSLAK